MRSDATFLAYCHSVESPTTTFNQCLTELVGYDGAGRARLAEHGYLAMRSGTDGLSGARNKVVRQLLASDAQWLFWLDDDMGFAPDTLDRLHEVADPDERPIVGALCFAMKETGVDGLFGFKTTPVPVIYDWVRDEVQIQRHGQGFTPRRDYSRNAVVQCGATGSACVLIHRSVFEKIAETYLPQGQGWYDKAKLTPETLTEGATVMAEDLSFCLRAASVGCPTFVHTGVKTTHYKHLWLGEDRYLAESWPEPATDRVDVLVPVLGRPEHAKPFMDSLRASTSLADVTAITNTDDQDAIAAWQKTGARVVSLRGVETFAEKVNHAYQLTSNPWVLLVGSDVIFRPGWFDRALRAAGDRFHLVGTNDLSDLQRDLAVHPLIRRSWIDEHGASWDGPGTVAHEGYGHCFVDNEWTAVARQAGVLIHAPDSVIEHLHPLFHKAEVDPIYEKGYSTYDLDQGLWEERSRQYLNRFSLEESIVSYPRQWHTLPGIVKIAEDLERYEHILTETKPEVVVETGSYTGESARWFASHGVEVISIDIAAPAVKHDGVTFIEGSSTDPDVVEQVTKLVGGRRCMVVLDSDHSALHVATELECYWPLVSPGCFLVVEDTICRWVPDTPNPGPLDAIESFLPHPFFAADEDVQDRHPATHHMGGWLRRAG